MKLPPKTGQRVEVNFMNIHKSGVGRENKKRFIRLKRTFDKKSGHGDFSMSYNPITIGRIDHVHEFHVSCLWYERLHL
jgi:hypothetical protein